MAQPLEPPWYGPVCPVVWEGRSREASPYPDQWREATIAEDLRRWSVAGLPTLLASAFCARDRRIEQSASFKHGTGDVEQTIANCAEGGGHDRDLGL